MNHVQQSSVSLPEPVACVVESSRKVIRTGLKMSGSVTDCQELAEPCTLFSFDFQNGWTSLRLGKSNQVINSSISSFSQC